ncbi:hypothetical protein SAMN05421858_5117 [Haladaptatus litoreus]|uniref:Uncharacterized protein n=1 Tax=Haladaptatus litoreus TaxID=553468 RepID=A0A1N7FJ06_9EURY|nr:hypothetical protein [Haladaptatus litoreus]SIS00329.1 hypothetical protein SAMN05421858_5117 [Haladaptatus litoreus]
MTSDRVFSGQLRDTSTYSFPDPAVSGGFQTKQRSAIAKVVNTLNKAVTVTLFGSTYDDAGMEQDVKNDPSTTSVSVPAGESAVLGTEHPWSFLRVEASPKNAPDSGGLKVVFQSESER